MQDVGLEQYVKLRFAGEEMEKIYDQERSRRVRVGEERQELGGKAGTLSRREVCVVRLRGSNSKTTS